MISVVIPVYNFEPWASDFVKKFSEALALRTDVEVFITDNGSKDNTSATITRVLESISESRIKLITLSPKMEEGAAILFSLRQCLGDVLAWSGPEIDPKDILHPYETYRLHNQVEITVKGFRKGLVGAQFLNIRLQNIIGTWLSGMKLNDVFSGPKMVSREFYNKFLRNSAPTDASFDLYAVYWAAKWGRLIEIDVSTYKRLSPGPQYKPKPVPLQNLLKMIRQVKHKEAFKLPQGK